MDYFSSPALAEHFIDDVLANIRERYSILLPDGEVAIQGQAISYLLTSMRDIGWKRLGPLGDFESALESVGFRVLEGRNSRGGRCRVVTV